MPRVSVVLPVHDGEDHIESAVETALAQTLEDFELLVIDDGSTDRSGEIVARLARRDARIRALHQENRGLSAARNRGLEEARGALIAFLDHDDLWHPRKLQLQVECLDRRAEVGLVACFSALIGPDGRLLGWPFGVRARADAHRQMLECDVVSGGSVAMVRRECLERVGSFDPELSSRADWDLWIRIASAYAVTTVPEFLVGYRRTSGGMSTDYALMAETGNRVLAKAFAEAPELPRRFRRRCLARDAFAVACFCLLDRERREAWRYLRRSLATSPGTVLFSPRRWALVGALGAATVLPEFAFDALHGLVARGLGLRRGAPFESLIRAGPGNPDVTLPLDGTARGPRATSRT